MHVYDLLKNKYPNYVFVNIYILLYNAGRRTFSFSITTLLVTTLRRYYYNIVYNFRNGFTLNVLVQNLKMISRIYAKVAYRKLNERRNKNVISLNPMKVSVSKYIYKP